MTKIPEIIGDNIQIYEDALANSNLKLFEDLDSEHFPWHISKIIDEKDGDPVPKENENLQFVHTVYKDHAPYSNYFNMCVPLLDFIQAKSVYRIKINLTFPTKEPKKLGEMHNDLFWVNEGIVDCKVAIFYPFKTNGQLHIKEGKEIHEIENNGNQVIKFSNQLKHLGISNTDENLRFAVNIVYF